MARYWVGGSGNFSDTAHWSDTSGGASGFSVPGSADDVLVDSNSGSFGQITVNTTKTIKSLDFTGSTMSIFFSSNSMTVQGNVTFAGKSCTGTGGFTINPQSADATLTCNGTAIVLDPVGLNGASSSARVLLADSLSCKQSGSLRGFNFVTNGNSIFVGAFQPDTASGTVDISNSTITLNSDNSNINIVFVALNGTNFISTGSTIVVTGVGNNQTFSGGGNTFNDVTYSSSVKTTGSNTFNNLTMTAGKTYTLQSGTTNTVNATWTALGTSGSHITLTSSAPGSAASLCTGTTNISFVDVTDITASCSVIVDPGGGDNGGNNGWEFDIGSGLGALGIFEL